jgi:TRAP-type C4-dicarboxylate transport system permease small subunit
VAESSEGNRLSVCRVLWTLCTHPVEWACGVLMAAIATVVFLQVFTRYVLAYPWGWPEEFARILFVWVALLGAVLAFRRAGHFSIDALANLLPALLRRPLAAAMRVGLLGFLLLVAYLGLQATLRVQEQLTTAMEISMSWGYASVPVSFACMALETVRLIWRDLRGSAR